MADVTGSIGGQPVELNNAATEATLKQLLAAMLAMASAKGKAGGSDGKAAKDLEKRLKDLAKASGALTDAQREAAAEAKRLAAEVEAAAAAAQKQKEAMAALGSVMSSFTSTVLKTATGMTNLLNSLANMGDSLSSAAQSFSGIPVIGGAMATVFGAVVGAAEKTYKSLQQAAAVGASFGGSMTEMIDSATSAGLTFDQFTGIIARTGEGLALLGGTTGEGAKRVAAMGKAIKNTDLERNLAAMGYSTEQINEGFAKYGGMMARTGAAQNMSNAQLAQAAGNYLTNLDAVSRLTGQSKKDLEAEREARLKDSQIRAMLAGKSVAEQEAINKMLDTIPAEHRAGMKEILATGTATSEAGKNAFAFLPNTAKTMMNLNGQMSKGIAVTSKQADAVQAGYQKEAKALAESPLGTNLAKFGTEAQKSMMIGAYNTAQQTKNMTQVNAEIQAERDKNKTTEAAAMMKMKQNIAETSNEFTKILASSQLLPAMMDAFKLLVGFTETFVVPAFKFIGDNSTAVGIVLGTMTALIVGTNAALAISNFHNKLKLAGELKYIALLKLKVVKSLLLLAPFIKIIAIVGLAVLAFKLLYDNFDGFADLMDNIADGFLRLLNKITFGKYGISEEEYEKRTSARRERRESGVSRKEQAQQASVPSSGPVQDQLKAQLASQGITDPKAVANIMAQVQAESNFKPQDENLKYSGKKLFELYGTGNKGGNQARFKTVEEAEAVAAKGPEAVGNVIYGGRMGNKEDEGFKYRGRGLIQLTGKDNYKKFGNMIGVDLVANPDLANDPAIASKIAAAYFADKQKAGVDLTSIAAVGKAVGYAGGTAETEKRAQLAQGFLGQSAGGSAPTDAQVAAATAPPSAAAAAAPAVATAQPAAGAPGAVQETVTALLAQINNKMDLMLKVGKEQTSLQERRMTAMKANAGSGGGNIGDVMAA